MSWWVTPEAYERGFQATLHTALRHWATADFPFTNPYFSNRENRRRPERVPIITAAHFVRRPTA